MGNSLKIQDYEKLVPDAFHGTSYEQANKIAAEQKFELSRGDNYYLGDGVYFFENSKLSARNWAVNIKKYNRYGILKATIKLGKCLDLNNEEHTRHLRTVEENLRKRNLEGITDGYLINVTAKILGADTVRGTFIKENAGKLFQKSRLYNKSQLVICVRNVDNILTIYLVKGAY
ncbi:MAG: hypothetical protein WCJ01_06820 [Ignavibacteria bacterium]